MNHSHLTSEWSVIARKGDHAQVLNTGIAAAELGGPGAPNRSTLPPGGHHTSMSLRGDLHARAIEPGAVVLVTITPGLPNEM